MKDVQKFVRNNGLNGYKIWCIFDKDNFEDFDSAIQLIEKNKNDSNNNKYYAGWSNSCFELWVLLHFYYLTNQYSCDDYIKKLNKIFLKKWKKKYTKEDDSIFSCLLKDYNQAISNAKKLYMSYSKMLPSKMNPCTTVYKLVDELKAYFPNN